MPGMTVHFVNLLGELRRRSLRMASEVEDIVQEACEAVFDVDERLARRVVTRDNEVDEEEVAVETEVIRLMALYQPMGVDLRTLCTVLKINNDLERIADCAVNLAERARHGEVQALARDSESVAKIVQTTQRLLSKAIDAYRADDAQIAQEVLFSDQTVDDLYAQIVRQVVADASSATAQMAGYLDLLSVAKNLERIADHATNIAEDVIYLATGQIVRHRHDELEAAGEA